MHHFYINQEVTGDELVISETKTLHHLKDVLRLKVNDPVVVFDTQGYEYDCVIRQLDKNKAVLVIGTGKLAKPGSIRIAVACAMPKGDGMDDIIDSLTQLGVATIIPLETERVIVRLDELKRRQRLDRWRRIARSAAQQSQRGNLPEIEPTMTDFEDLMVRAQDFDLKLILTLTGDRQHISEVVSRVKPRNVLVLIGPEGDFTAQEVAQAKDAGFIAVSLGDNVLRVGTAAVAATSYLKLSFGL